MSTPRKNAQKPAKRTAKSRGGYLSLDARHQYDVRLLKVVSNQNQTVLRRITTGSSVATNVAGVVVTTTLANANSVTTYTGFSDMAAAYSSWRLRAIKVTWLPFYPVNTTAIVVPALMIVVPFRAGLVPSGFVNYIESSEAKYVSGYKGGSATTDHRGYDNADLWNPTNAVISSANDWGLSVMGQASPASTVSTFVWLTTIEAVVEFRVTG